jgi:hypothetical protein
MASNPPGACCVRGIRHEGTPAGEMRIIGKGRANFQLEFGYIVLIPLVPAYISAPPNSQSVDKAVLFLSDVFGVRITANFWPTN